MRSPQRLEHVRDGLLREPVDLEVGMQRAQLARDRDVAPGVAEPDRGGDVERALVAPDRAAPARPAAAAARRRARRSRAAAWLNAHRVAGVRAVAGALELDQLGAGALGERRAAVGRDQVVLVALDDEQRAAQPAEQLAHRRARRARARRSCSASVSGVVSSAQPMESSICLVECGSGKQRPKKNSR